MHYEAAIRTVSWASVLVAGATYIQAPAPVAVRNPEPSADSVIYRLTAGSRLQVKTGKAGVFGFAGHNHLIESHAVHGEVVYYPGEPTRSHLEITVDADSLQVLTPPDTEEIRKVGETMRTEVLRTADYPVIRLVSREVQPKEGGFHVVGAMTLAGQTRTVPLDVVTRITGDTLEAGSTFSVKQTDYGITPFRGGPGGAVKVADRVTIQLNAVAVRAEDSGIEHAAR
ncbi:MAG TPA: YceI family protein [Gemmatimonadales bacterium]|nr:YceI family protein [Gemmatimonadales bacterium]